MEENAPSLELYDIPSVQDLIPRFWIPWWAWIAAPLALIALFLLIRALRGRTRKVIPSEEAYQRAMDSLEQAKDIKHIVALATAVSLILRRYLAIALADSSLFETHEEFLARHQALEVVPDELRRSLTDYFTTLCRYKYAPTSTSVDGSLLVPQAISLLQQLRALPRPALSSAS
jgi:hypothetical protein